MTIFGTSTSSLLAIGILLLTASGADRALAEGTETKVAEARIVSCADVKTREWYAWNDRMPPKPDDFHLVGEVYVPNPGVRPFLTLRQPQGINPKILLLDLHLYQHPGNWSQVFLWIQTRYDRVLQSAGYERVQIYCGSNVLGDLPVEDIHLDEK